MKKRLLILITIGLLATNIITAQSWTFSTKVSGSQSLIEISSVINIDGSVLSLGYFEGTLSSSNGLSLESYGSRDYFLINFSATGEVAWMLQLGGNMKEFSAGGVGVDLEGSIYVAGGFQGILKYSETDSIESSGSYDLFLTKISNNGEILWVRNAGSGAKAIYPTFLKIDQSGDVLLTGSFKDSINIYDNLTLKSENSSPDIFYSKFDPNNGDLVWIKQGMSLHLSSGNFWNIETTSNSYYFTGIYSDSIGFESDTLIPDKSSFNVFLLKTDLSGTILWHRTVQGNQKEYCYAIASDENENIYISGFYDSDTLFLDSTETTIVESIGNNGSTDIFTIKYNESGDLLWYRVDGGKGGDRVYKSTFFDSKLYLSGGFADTLKWGGIQLISEGINDNDMLSAAFDENGNYREANSFSGRNNSTEEARAIYQNGDNLLTVLRSNSDVLVLGDSIYTSTNETFYMILGIIGCLPISIDNVITQNVETCSGDSTGAIQILASGGFGAPWQYSVDNGLTYQDVAYFANLPASDFPIVVIDAENCAQPGPTETVIQPEPLSLELITEEFTGDSMVNIVVAAYGGTPPYTYTLQPNGIVQGFGDFSVKWSQPGYYKVEVNDIRNCGPVVTDSLNVSSGIDLYAPGVKLYPNPTSGIITVEVPFQGSACTLEVLSLTGQVMFSRQVYSNGISINETINLSELSKGMYMIRVDGQTLKSGVVLN